MIYLPHIISKHGMDPITSALYDRVKEGVKYTLSDWWSEGGVFILFKFPNALTDVSSKRTPLFKLPQEWE